MHGEGELTYEDGRKYEGAYYNDQKHGHGKYTWPNGKSYDGQWKNGKQHGHAIFTSSTGESRKGYWENGDRIEWLDDSKDAYESNENPSMYRTPET